VWDWPAAAPTEPAMRSHPQVLSGFVLPVGGLDVPTEEQYLPNSPRAYRAGYHEGIDFPVKAGTPVLAAKGGTIVRIDGGFTEWSPDEEQAAFDAALALGYTPSATLDHLRGRQVWIDHGQGIVTRYAHLSAVAPLREGDVVTAGEVIGAAGSSGYSEGGPHLHFEIRVGEDFYGDGLPLPQLRYAISAAFR
jgi:murein DD-endopeptidase MepM/ murein hydrolase activator NlpD